MVVDAEVAREEDERSHEPSVRGGARGAQTGAHGGYARAMFGRSYRIATIRGVPVSVDASWIWVAVLVTYSMWLRFDGLYHGTSAIGALGFAILTAVLFFGAVFLHEAAHAVAARLQDIEVFGITLVVFGGFTSARADQRGPGPAFIIAAVGPATSLVLGGLCWAVSRIVGDASAPLAAAFGYVGWVNLLMAGFNVLPGLPLDGGRMLETAVWRFSGSRERGTVVAATAGIVVGGLIVAAGLVEAARGDLVGAVWSGIIGAFILQGARSARTGARATARLSSGRVRDAMSLPPLTVPADLSLSEALDRFLRGRGEEEAFPVTDGGRLVGLVSLATASPVGAEDPLRPVRDAMVPIERFLVVGPDEPLDRAAVRIAAEGVALVVESGAVVGALSGEDVVRWIERNGSTSGGVGARG